MWLQHSLCNGHVVNLGIMQGFLTRSFHHVKVRNSIMIGKLGVTVDLGRVAIVVVPWSDPLFMERSLTQQFGQQERSNFFGSV